MNISPVVPQTRISSLASHLATLTVLAVTVLAACGGDSKTSPSIDAGNPDFRLPQAAKCTLLPPEPTPPASAGPTGTFNKINHFVVIYLENRSFDHLFGEYPGAEGIKAAMKARPQLDDAGKAYRFLPPPIEAGSRDQTPDPRFPTNLANRPFLLDQIVPTDTALPDMVHQFYEEQIQIDGGRMDKFIRLSKTAVTLGYYHTAPLPVATLARNFTVADHFFHAAFGGSFLNHQFLIAARPPVFEAAPASMFPEAYGDGTLRNGTVTVNGCYVMNTAYSANTPNPYVGQTRGMPDGGVDGDAGDPLALDGGTSPAREEGDAGVDAATDGRFGATEGGMSSEDTAVSFDTGAGVLDAARPPGRARPDGGGFNPLVQELAQLVPSQSHATIGDRLSDKNISWAWYAGGWDDAAAGKADPLFQYHHQAFVFFDKYAPNTPGRAEHLKDEQKFLAAAAAGELPSVSFIKPLGSVSEHPGFSSVVASESHVIQLVDAVRNGPQWKDTAIIITYDENGGLWDHVAPPVRDAFGPGVRVPAIIVSPYAKKGYVDKTVYDTLSILATIEHRYGLDPLTMRDARAKDMAAAFNFAAP